MQDQQQPVVDTSLNNSHSLLNSSTMSQQAAGAVVAPTERAQFSGFATAKQESIYDKLVEKSLQLLSQRVLMLMENTHNNNASVIAFHSWGKQVIKVWKYLTLMEKNKQQMPLLADILEPLGVYLKEQLQSIGRSDSIDKGLGSCQTSDIGTHRGLSNLDEMSQKNFRVDKLATSSLMMVEESQQNYLTGGPSKKVQSQIMEDQGKPRKITQVPIPAHLDGKKLKKIVIQDNHSLNHSMNVSLPLKAAHPVNKTKDDFATDGQSGLRSSSSKQIVNNSNLRLAPPSSDLSAIMSIAGSSANASTKAKINLHTKDFEKLFSQNNEEQLVAAFKSKKQGGGVMFMKNGRFCMHQDSTHCETSCFDYQAQVNKLQSVKRQVRQVQDEEEGRQIRKVAIRQVISGERQPSLQKKRIIPKPMPDPPGLKQETRILYSRKSQSQPRGTSRMSSSNTSQQTRRRINYEAHLIMKPEAFDESQPNAVGATILVSKSDLHAVEENEPQFPNIHVLNENNDSVRRNIPRRNYTSQQQRSPTQRHGRLSPMGEMRQQVNERRHQQLSQISSRSSGGMSNSTGQSPNKTFNIVQDRHNSFDPQRSQSKQSTSDRQKRATTEARGLRPLRLSHLPPKFVDPMQISPRFVQNSQHQHLNHVKDDLLCEELDGEESDYYPGINDMNYGRRSPNNNQHFQETVDSKTRRLRKKRKAARKQNKKGLNSSSVTRLPDFVF